jgi:predicted DNA-binding protein
MKPLSRGKGPAPIRSIRLPEKLTAALEKLAKADHRKFSDYVRLVLEDHVAKKVGR